MAERKPIVPIVIRPHELADILTHFAAVLKKWDNEKEAIQVRAPGSKPSLDAPSLSVVINFDPKTLNAKTITVANTKTVVKDWNKDHGVGS